MAMFASLAALVEVMEHVDLKITGTSSEMTVIVLPKCKPGSDAALATPLRFVGTPDEIDASFAQAIASTVTARKSLMAATEEANLLIEAATQAQQKKGQKALQKVSKDTPSVTSHNNTESETLNVSPTQLAKPEDHAASHSTNLFGDD